MWSSCKALFGIVFPPGTSYRTAVPRSLTLLALLCALLFPSCASSPGESGTSPSKITPGLSRDDSKPSSYTGDAPFLAVCYTRRDRDRVYPLIQSLQKSGYRVWYDEGIPLGVNWEDDVADRLNRAEQVLVFISPNAMKSDWTRREVSFSLNRKKTLLPLYLEDTKLPDGWEFLIGSIQYLHTSDPRLGAKLHDTLSRRARQPAFSPLKRR